MTRPVITTFPARFSAFALHLAGLFALTYLLLTPGWPIWGGWSAVGLSVLLTFAYMFAFDDFAEWRRHAQTIWTLTPTHLIYENPIEDAAPHAISLQDIRKLSPRFGTSLVARLENGQSITMAYIGAPRQAVRLIQAAKDASA